MAVTPQNQTPASEFAAAIASPHTDAAYSAGAPDGAAEMTMREYLAAARRPIIAGAAGLALALTGGGIAYANVHKTVQLDVDGRTRSVETFSRSVADVLADEGIEYTDADQVIPAPSEPLVEGETITVRYAAELTFTADDLEFTTVMPALDAADALDALAERGGNVALVASRSGDRVDLGIRLAANQAVVVVADSQQHLLTRAGGSVGSALAEAGITLGAEDAVRVVPVANLELEPTNAEVAVVVTRIATTEEVSEFELEFEQVTQNDATLYKGTNKVIQAGQLGKRVLVEQVRTVDGVEVSRTTVSDEVVAEPVNQITAIGTKAKPVAAKPGGGGNLGSAPSGTIWAALAQCESGGNPAAVSANGKYHGLYQFSVATWKSVGGTGLPSQASAAEQTQRAQILQARSGWGQWPACAKKLGLL